MLVPHDNIFQVSIIPTVPVYHWFCAPFRTVSGFAVLNEISLRNKKKNTTNKKREKLNNSAAVANTVIDSTRGIAFEAFYLRTTDDLFDIPLKHTQRPHFAITFIF